VKSIGSGVDRALRIFASSIARELKQRGYDARHVVALASELIGLACESIRSAPLAAEPVADADLQRRKLNSSTR